MSCDVGIYGLAVMGLGLSLNLASRGIRVSVCNRTSTKVDGALKQAKDENFEENIFGARTLEDFVQSLKKPRRIIMVIEAGAPVDALINHLLPKLDAGDCLVDAGNEFFEVSEKRERLCASKGVLFMDVGLCAGEGGARSGPPLTPGGSLEAWNLMEPIFVQLAGKIDASKTIPLPGALTVSDEEKQNACVSHLGPCGAGHYVKMVHNGIMYGDMQLIAEAHQLLKFACDLSNEELHVTFKKWNEDELHSYLLGITANIVRKKDSFTGGYLLDFIADTAGSKGTGKWTMQQAAELGVAVPTITAALDMRYICSNQPLRQKMNCLYAQNWCSLVKTEDSTKEQRIESIRRALVCGRICCFAQGMHLLRVISEQKGWGVDLSEVSRIWQAGCVIECDFLKVMQRAFRKKPDLESILLSEEVHTTVQNYLPALQEVISLSLGTATPRPDEPSVRITLPTPAHSASYNYLASSCGLRLSMNLVQAQRDCFGAHHFKRTDREGKYHVEDWGA
ncbi:6-phosphogluconate dehydrogenase [Toxoplasma gondii TgCatPRC2]|uniref:6-phosphogluconate dehydrogenase, decarboxylating n=6 Tax=Toxoplasma gondii TaxID=5811 RepID=B6KFP9_TOXGV|nr:6-phosphogluconate dehydrogenase [Toxoplasma gondii ME49]ESS31535.1 6-phosphogluconate dehydrogenase [Toxoplasma gondii VEG]KFG29002.1 6-phosphogluconate dehydrogenase [Toxoplasma gondii p89]KFH06871.1 6-phosphogluconate dehydrogenase [Toxoplasma gondii MAS]KYK72202.1 6-phosphogluconate dehydrogenase [Toxoplasma gondii TgCatPRC2]PUA88394.1 6-phosphogluconate dehydrogenase [Toxoplasma gondii TgCATBr9]|eukprot:XP_002366780.1 6-phosphogluconate dehydrogenase [Toxoplasma gondii ME49]